MFTTYATTDLCTFVINASTFKVLHVFPVIQLILPSVFSQKQPGARSVITLLGSVCYHNCCHFFIFHLIMVYLTILSIYQAMKHQMHGCGVSVRMGLDFHQTSYRQILRVKIVYWFHSVVFAATVSDLLSDKKDPKTIW